MSGEMSAHLYETVKFLHILAAIVWVGGAVVIQFISVRTLRAEPIHWAHLAGNVEWLGKRVFMPVSGLLFLLGLWMAFGWIGWPVWIWIGIAGFAATFVTGSFFLGPAAGRLKVALDERGPEDPEVLANLRRILMVSRVDLAVLIIVVWDMAYKPFS